MFKPFPTYLTTPLPHDIRIIRDKTLDPSRPNPPIPKSPIPLLHLINKNLNIQPIAIQQFDRRHQSRILDRTHLTR